MGRDSWDWVGPPAWVRACFNSTEWGGGSSPVKTEPPQIVLLLLFLTQVNEDAMCLSTQRYGLMGMSPRWQRTLRHRGLRKLALNSGTTRRSAKNAEKPRKNLHRRHNRSAESRVSPLLRTGMFVDSGYELNLWHFHCRNKMSLHDHKDVHNLSMNCAMSSTTRHLSLHTKGMQQPVQNSTICNCGSSAVSSSSALENCRTCTTNKSRPPYQCTTTGESLGDRTKGICICATTGMSTTWSKEVDKLQLWDLDCLLTAAHVLAGPAQQTSITLSMYCNGRISMVF